MWGNNTLGTSRLYSWLVLGFFLSPPLAFADETTDLSLFNDEIPVVLSATRLAQPQTEAPASITIIDRELIKLSSAKSIPEIFRLVPGMHVNYIRGNRAVVGYQGISSEFPQGVQVLIDGKSEYRRTARPYETFRFKCRKNVSSHRRAISRPKFHTPVSAR